VGAGAADLLHRLLSVDPEQRPLPDEVLAHPWMNGERICPPLLCVWVRALPACARSLTVP
jgi:serine/threonine protein kinase